MTMPSSTPAQTQDSSSQTHTHQTKSSDPTTGDNTLPPQNEQNQESNEVEAAEEEEESECGFCLYMKAGGCRDPFIEWEKCIEEGENNNEDIVEKCQSVTKALKDCMEANPDHYGPILQAEKAAEQKLEKEMEKEKEKEKEGNVESNSRPEEERKQPGLAVESVAMFEVEEIPKSTDSEQKMAI